jgi:hypothetical protein
VHLPHLPNWEAQLRCQLRQQKVVAQCLAHLHDPHDGGVNLVEAVLQHLLVGLLAVLIAVMHLQVVDLHTEHAGRVAWVDLEHIAASHLRPCRLLQQHPVMGVESSA